MGKRSYALANGVGFPLVAPGQWTNFKGATFKVEYAQRPDGGIAEGVYKVTSKCLDCGVYVVDRQAGLNLRAVRRCKSCDGVKNTALDDARKRDYKAGRSYFYPTDQEILDALGWCFGEGVPLNKRNFREALSLYDPRYQRVEPGHMPEALDRLEREGRVKRVLFGRYANGAQRFTLMGS